MSERATSAELVSARRRIYALAFLRATAVGLIGVELGLYLAERSVSKTAAGAIVGAGLAGCAAAALAATLVADRSGRRRTLAVLALAGSLGALAFAASAHPLALALAAFGGMLNGMGRDRGAALIVEQAILPATVDASGRTRALAVYNLMQDAGHAVGSLLAGLVPALASSATGAHESHRASLGVYAALCLAGAAISGLLPRAVEAEAARERRPVSPATRSILLRISALFALDSLGGGFLTTALLSYFFVERFGAGGFTVAALFAAARVLNALSHLGAAWLASRIGLVRTMVFTHLPSSLLLVTVAWAPSFPVAAVLFLLREGLVEMDVPTRQSYVLAIVAPHERTLASGVTHLVRLCAWAVAPFLAGAAMEEASLAAPLYAGAALKIVYDLWLYRAFVRLKPPEEA